MPIGEDPLGTAAWSLEVDGITLATFQEVSGLSTEVSVIEFKSNNKSGKPVTKKVPGAHKNGDITFKRGKTDDQALWKWIEQVQLGKIDAARRNASIVLYDYEHGERARYNVLNCWPSKVSIAGLKAGDSNALVEDVTLTHEGLTVA
jgi:phage tail-like protein